MEIELGLYTGSKIYNSNDTVRLLSRVNDVFRLEVSVDDPCLVAENDCTQDLFHDLSTLSLVKPLLGNDLIEELSSSAELSHNVQVRIVLVILENIKNVRMVQFT